MESAGLRNAQKSVANEAKRNKSIPRNHEILLARTGCAGLKNFSAAAERSEDGQNLQNRPQGQFFVRFTTPTKSSKVEFKKAAKNHYF